MNPEPDGTVLKKVVMIKIKKMKKTYSILILLAILLLGSEVRSQILIGKETPSNSSVLLEFGSENKGLILPSVIDAPNAVGGSFFYHLGQKSVIVVEERNNGVSNNWTNLSANETEGISHGFLNSGNDIIETVSGVVLGAETSSKPGVLVLESTEKVMVLPKVSEAHTNMSGVIAGTMVYDEASDMVAVYDGANWSYWN